uniref:Uncharacterized protein n=1 Tax=Oryza punctata TaxID=4537 RepID=A0A0E0JNR1_ORYPU
MGGGMEVHKNKWIEEWNAGRENLEFNFRWTRRSLAVVGLFGLAVPILVYKGIVPYAGRGCRPAVQEVPVSGWTPRGCDREKESVRVAYIVRAIGLAEEIQKTDTTDAHEARLIAGHTCLVMNGDTSIEATAQKKKQRLASFVY